MSAGAEIELSAAQARGIAIAAQGLARAAKLTEKPARLLAAEQPEAASDRGGTPRRRDRAGPRRPLPPHYVLPFRLGDSLMARIDVKSDRRAGILRVLGAFAEPGADPGAVAPELADELLLLAGWLELEHVSVATNGDLAGKLAKAVTAARGRPPR